MDPSTLLTPLASLLFWTFLNPFQIFMKVSFTSIYFTMYYDFIYKLHWIVSIPAVFNVTNSTALEVCDLESLQMPFSIMCTVDPAAVILWEVTGVTPPLGSAIARGETVRFFTYPKVMGQATLYVNDTSGQDVKNQTCFICRADYPSGDIFRSDPLCVDVPGRWIPSWRKW